jgi:hypothetical protein
MKKALFIAAAAVAFISGAAHADTLSVNSVTAVTVPSSQIISASTIHFVGTPTISFAAAGKTCTWLGSGAGASVPSGCNYGITVNTSTNTLSNPTSLDNANCTPTSQMLSLCK